MNGEIAVERQPFVKVKELSRWFGDLAAVSQLSFDLYPGEVVGFIGANGAGKTTTMRMMASLEYPTSGTVEICGYDVFSYPSKVRPLIGWMPDSYGRYPLTTVFDYLEFYARAYGNHGAELSRRLEEVMEFTSLGPLRDKDIDTLSKGMAQRLCLGRMLLNDPKILIMDEPAAGLDPKARIEFKRLVRLLAAEKKAIIISSHILSELEDMCDSLLFINRGKIAHHGDAATLKSGGAGQYIVEIKVAGDVEALVQQISFDPELSFIERTKAGCKAQLKDPGPEGASAALRRLVQAGLAVTDFHRQEQRLEEAFIEMLRKLEGEDDAAS